MLKVGEECPICSYGEIGFFRCSDGETLILMCNECSSVWDSPECIFPEEADAPQPPEFKLAGKNCSITGGQSGWANFAEVTNKGWESFVV